MNADVLLKQGKPLEALEALQNAIRANPGDGSLRVFLFQLSCVLGRFEKALNQLQVVAGLDSDKEMLARVFRPIIECEVLRSEVFAGRRTPLIFGEPEPWIGMMIHALGLVASGDYAAAAALREKALEASAFPSCQVDGVASAVLADVDSRLGPMTELILDGKYYWVPFTRVRKIQIEKPSDLRDLVWLPATFQWTNGGQCTGHIPVRYPGTEKSLDGALLMARKTEFPEPIPGTCLPLGQRVWAAEADDVSLLDVRLVEFPI